MTPEQFAYWLQGFVEQNGGKMPTTAQWKSVRDHLKTVFVKVTPTAKKLAGRVKIDENATDFEQFMRSLPQCSHDMKIC